MAAEENLPPKLSLLSLQQEIIEKDFCLNLLLTWEKYLTNENEHLVRENAALAEAKKVAEEHREEIHQYR